MVTIQIKEYKKYFRIIGLILFIYILFKINWFDFFLIFKNLNLFYFCFSLFLIFPLLLLLTLKWKILVNCLEIKIPFKKLFKFFLKGLFLGIITPGKVGEFYRGKYLSDATGTSLDIGLLTAIFDRLFDLITVVFIGGVGSLLISLIFKIEKFWLIGILFFILFIFGIYFSIKKSMAKNLLELVIKFLIPNFLKDKTKNILGVFFQKLEKLEKIVVTKIIVVELVAYTISILACYSIALSLGISVSFWYLFLINAIVDLVIILPISILGLGTREASYIFFFSLLRISSTVAVSFSLLILIWSIFRAIPGAIIFLKGE